MRSVTAFPRGSINHMHHGVSAGRTVWGWDYPTWALFHQLSSAALLAFAAWHLHGPPP